MKQIAILMLASAQLLQVTPQTPNVGKDAPTPTPKVDCRPGIQLDLPGVPNGPYCYWSGGLDVFNATCKITEQNGRPQFACTWKPVKAK